MHISVYDEAVICINVRVLCIQRKTLINNSTDDVQMCQINESDTQRTEVWERINKICTLKGTVPKASQR